MNTTSNERDNADSKRIAGVILSLIGQGTIDWRAAPAGDAQDSALKADGDMRKLIDLVNVALAAPSSKSAEPVDSGNWRVGEFWSSAEPSKTCLMLSRGVEEIAAHGRHKDFIRWVGASDTTGEAATIDTLSFRLAFYNILGGQYFSAVQHIDAHFGAPGPAAHATGFSDEQLDAAADAAIAQVSAARQLDPRDLNTDIMTHCTLRRALVSAGAALVPGSHHKIVFANNGEQPEDTAHLNCTACGGSGHIGDQQERAGQVTLISADHPTIGEPTMLWDADDPEDGTHGDSPKDFAENYIGNSGLREEVEVDVLCAYRGSKRTMRISPNGEGDVSWSWVASSHDNASPPTDAGIPASATVASIPAQNPDQEQ